MTENQSQHLRNQNSPRKDQNVSQKTIIKPAENQW